MNISAKYAGTFSDYSGYGNANRNFLTALFVAGVNLTTELIVQVPERIDLGYQEKLALSLQDRGISYKIKILHITPDMYPRYKEPGIYNIGHLFWETTKLPELWVHAINGMSEIWTASDQQTHMMRESGVTVPIFSFPQPIDVTLGEEVVRPFETQYKKDFVFYSVFQWIDRKNPRGLLRSYWKAFEGNNDITLLLKTYRVNYNESEFMLIKHEIDLWKKELGQKHYPKIFLLKRLIRENDMKRLHVMGDCYVNPSSGEGWSRPMQEAMLFGEPVISGNNGGITDIMTSQYYNEVPSSLQKVTEASWIPWYTQDQEWKVLDEDALGKTMKDVYSNYGKAKTKAKLAKKFVNENFNFQTVGGLMRKRLELIQKGL